MLTEMTYENWITKTFHLWHPELLDYWLSEKSFGTTKDLRVAEQMKDVVSGYWEMEIEQLKNPFLRSALETALNEINWRDLAEDYFEALETY